MKEHVESQEHREAARVDDAQNSASESGGNALLLGLSPRFHPVMSPGCCFWFPLGTRLKLL